jgi:PLP dependent protein
MADVGGNYRKLVERIDEAAAKSGREASAIKLLAAAKSQRIDAIRAALAAGVTLIGENYVQEAGEKKGEISTPVEWHMIGHLQRNKVRLAVGLFDVIESLDNLALARELDKEGRRCGQIIRAFVEINLGGEESKTGIAKKHVPSLLESVAKLANLRVEGLMTVPPFRQDPEQVRPYFRELRELKEKIRESGFPNVDLKELSMGMTHDYPVAVEEGATIVRIGTALFGPRGA